MMNDSDELLEPVLTKAALLKGPNSVQFKAHVFEAPKRINKPEKQPSTHENDSKQPTTRKDEEGPEFDMKRARYEVLNFGIGGLRSRNKKKAQIALAVKLGAKESKKECKNYKDLLAEKKRAKQLKEEKLKLRQLGKNQTGAASIRYKKPRVKQKKNKVGEISRHYGVINPKIGKSK